MMFGDVLGIHFRDDQGHIRVHPVGAGVVDDHGPGLDGDGSKGLGDAAASEQGHIHSIKGIGLGFFHFIGLAPDGEFLAGAAGRSQQFQVLEGEIPFVQQIDEFLSNGARSTQDGQIVFFHSNRLLYLSSVFNPRFDPVRTPGLCGSPWSGSPASPRACSIPGSPGRCAR